MMYNFLKFSVWLGLLVLPTISMAVPPYANDNWTVTGGVVTATCPTGATCTMVASGGGFLQQLVTDTTTGAAYIQSITTDSTASFDPSLSTAPFALENWVQYNTTGGASNGISAQQTMSESMGTSTFTDSAAIDTGWAAGTGDNVVLAQTVDDPGVVAGTQFSSTFDYRGQVDATGLTLNHELAISQETGLFAAGGAATDKQKFAYQQSDRTTGGSMTLGGTTVSWVGGEQVNATWVGQVSTDSASGMTVPFGFTGIRNITTPAMAEETSLASTAPIAWPTDTGFSALPPF